MRHHVVIHPSFPSVRQPFLLEGGLLRTVGEIIQKREKQIFVRTEIHMQGHVVTVWTLDIMHKYLLVVVLVRTLADFGKEI